MNKAIIGVIIAVIVVPISVYAISPYFTESTINEEIPDSVITTQTEPEMMEGEAMTGDDTAETMEDESVTMEDDTAETMEDESVTMEDESVTMEGDTAETMEDESVTMEDESVTMEGDTAETMEDESVTMEGDTAETMSLKAYEGRFIGVGDGIHDAQGVARVLPLEGGSQILRLEDFRSTNGPDLYVYLATDRHASEFINLGELKANRGNQNYQIPDDADLEEYNQVLIWCKAFSVLFGNAELMSQ